jgi:hypothetical protein
MQEQYDDLLRIAKRLAVAASGEMHPDWYEGIGEDAKLELVGFLAQYEREDSHV